MYTIESNQIFDILLGGGVSFLKRQYFCSNTAKAIIYLYQKTFDKNVLTSHDMHVNDNESQTILNSMISTLKLQ
jgi:hypothetical protein